MAEQRPPRVFISYRHELDRPKHADRVLAFADRLRARGIDAIIDQYEIAPPEGWPAWCEREIEIADFVLMVCTEAYHRSLRGEEPQGEGQGVLWEARIIRQLIYDAGSKTAKVVPVLFADGSTEHVPSSVRGTTRHWIETETGYEDLYRQLTDQPRARKKELGSLEKLPERTRRWRERPLAELHDVPDLPPHFVPRSTEVAALAEKLLATNGGPVGVTGVATKVGMQRMSVLAAAAVHEDAVRAAFPGGIFWLALGQTPDLLSRKASLYSLLTNEPANFANAEDGRLKLQQALRGRACLVVLDDVRRLDDAEAFNVVDNAGRLLLTTRNGEIVRGISGRKHEVRRPSRALHSLKSECGIDYDQLESLLRDREWKSANRETIKILIRASGRLHFGPLDCPESRWTLGDRDIVQLPCSELVFIDALWSSYSNYRFGYATQLNVFDDAGMYEDPWREFYLRVGWHQGRIRYSIESPRGHLPTPPPHFTETRDGHAAILDHHAFLWNCATILERFRICDSE